MNYLVILPENIQGNTAIINGETADQLVDLHELKEGLSISALEYNGKRGKANVAEIQPGLLRLNLDLREEALDKKDLNLIVGLSRPQTVKKVISAATCLGVKNLHFVKSSNSEKSYLQSKVFEEENLQIELILAMAQSGESVPPKISIHSQFKKFLSDEVACFSEDTSKILADSKSDNVCHKSSMDSITLSVGPEKGWNEYEIQQFIELGFQAVSLGPRILRVEQAAISLISQAI